MTNKQLTNLTIEDVVEEFASVPDNWKTNMRRVWEFGEIASGTRKADKVRKLWNKCLSMWEQYYRANRRHQNIEWKLARLRSEIAELERDQGKAATRRDEARAVLDNLDVEIDTLMREWWGG